MAQIVLVTLVWLVLKTSCHMYRVEKLVITHVTSVHIPQARLHIILMVPMLAVGA